MHGKWIKVCFGATNIIHAENSLQILNLVGGHGLLLEALCHDTLTMAARVFYTTVVQGMKNYL